MGRRSNQAKEPCERWNKLHPEGTAVTVTKDDGSKLDTVTRSAAWVLGGHSAVILVHGISGGYKLTRVAARRMT